MIIKVSSKIRYKDEDSYYYILLYSYYSLLYIKKLPDLTGDRRLNLRFWPIDKLR